MYTDTVTLYNMASSSRNVYTWYPTVLHNVDLIISKGANIAKTGIEGADTASLHIKYTKDQEKGIMIGDKPYKRPKEWKAQTEEELPKTITFNSGKDFFIRGEFDEAVVIDDGTQYREGFDSFIQKKHDDIYVITNVDFFGVIPHFEIGGK